MNGISTPSSKTPKVSPPPMSVVTTRHGQECRPLSRSTMATPIGTTGQVYLCSADWSDPASFSREESSTHCRLRTLIRLRSSYSRQPSQMELRPLGLACRKGLVCNSIHRSATRPFEGGDALTPASPLHRHFRSSACTSSTGRDDPSSWSRTSPLLGGEVS